MPQTSQLSVRSQIERVDSFFDRMGRARYAAGTMALLLATLASVNLLDFPLSVPHMRRISGETYLDMQGFFSADDAYRLLVAFGPEGRRAQLRVTGLLTATKGILYTVTISLLIAGLFYRALLLISGRSEGAK